MSGIGNYPSNPHIRSRSLLLLVFIVALHSRLVKGAPRSSLYYCHEFDITILRLKASFAILGVCLGLPSNIVAMISMNYHQPSSYFPPSSSSSPSPPPAIYNGVNPNYPGLRMIHGTPPIYCVDQFLTPSECHFLIEAASDSFTPAPVVGKGSGEISASRTSSTCYLAREDVPDLMRKVSALTGKPIEHCELPQVGRYLTSQRYVQHFDAFNLDEEDGRRFASNGGQRTVTVLVYLNDVFNGGATAFPTLKLQIQPRQGMALVFFPATVDGVLDRQALHAALPALDTKYVSQIWIRQGSYFGQASKRLSQLMGPPLGAPATMATTTTTATLPSFAITSGAVKTEEDYAAKDDDVMPMSP